MPKVGDDPIVWLECSFLFASAMSGKIAETAFRGHAIGHLVETKSWGPKVVLCLGEMALSSLVLTLFCGNT